MISELWLKSVPMYPTKITLQIAGVFALSIYISLTYLYILGNTRSTSKHTWSRGRYRYLQKLPDSIEKFLPFFVISANFSWHQGLHLFVSSLASQRIIFTKKVTTMTPPPNWGKGSYGGVISETFCHRVGVKIKSGMVRLSFPCVYY